MDGKTLAVLVTIGFSMVGVLGDYFLKLASAHPQPMRTLPFYVGFAVYASTAFGWVFVMKYLKLATISVSTRPRYLPRMNCCRLMGLESSE